MPKPLFSSLLTLLILSACQPADDTAESALTMAGEDTVHPSLAAHSAEFEKKVYTVTDGVYQAVGFGLANSIMVEGDHCAFVVDVMGSTEAAQDVLAAFRRHTDKPVRALIYTHNHADHVFGGRGFVEDPSTPPVVYAHSTTEYYINRVVSLLRPVLSRRSGRMFGSWLPDSEGLNVINDGIGPYLEIGQPGHSVGLLRPQITFDDELDTEICGVQVHMEHAPGETNDQILVWLPERRVLMPGDNIYKTFPNLYTIRGTLYRDVMAWVHSLDRMRELRPAHLAPSHTQPLSGEDAIRETLTAYRDAIQFVHDQTIRGINRGLTPDELVSVVRLPTHLASHPWLQEHYGTVAWSVRNVFNGYLGWFDGNAATLDPLPPAQRAVRMLELAGGEAGLRQKLDTAIDSEQWRWAAELADVLLTLDPDDAQAGRQKARAMVRLGQLSVSPNGRNYYISQALELRGELDAEDSGLEAGVRDLLADIPIRNFIEAMPTRLDAGAAEAETMSVAWRFSDTGEEFTMMVRRGVAEVRQGLHEPLDATLLTTTQVWRDIATGERNAAVALASDAADVDGSTLKLIAFFGLFD